MVTRINTLSCDHARQLDLVAYLASIGHHPSKTKDCNYWYLSPLRNERTASFKVDGKLNVWYDHGLGKGGNLVDFGILYHQCTVAEFLKKLNETSFLQQPVKTIQPSEESIVKIISEKEISSHSLIHYLAQRKISETVAKKYCSEVTFSIRDKIYTAIGFRNNNGGFELRNSWF
ncbi:MAG: CHC2 zinc finger domain-containing protein, partial [Bacteroidota bacterium]